MRILSFSERWRKLNNPILFTTFRYPRRDRDWEPEEVVQVYFKARSPAREKLGTARIIRIETKDMSKRWSPFATNRSPNTEDMVTPVEAAEDGFYGEYSASGNVEKMRQFIRQPHRSDILNKLTLYWIERFNA